MPESDGQFSRDLGYLFRFIESLEAHAVELGGARGAALAGLLEGQAARWTEIATVLGGGAETEPTEAEERELSESHETTDVTLAAEATDPGGGTLIDLPAMSRSTVPRPPSTRTGEPSPPRAPLTVGSLVDAPRRR